MIMIQFTVSPLQILKEKHDSTFNENHGSANQQFKFEKMLGQFFGHGKSKY